MRVFVLKDVLTCNHPFRDCRIHRENLNYLDALCNALGERIGLAPDLLRIGD